MLISLTDDIFTQSAPLSLAGVRLGTRMTIVVLPTGRLWMHSPIPLDDELAAAIDDLGEVSDIVAPNLYHHLYAGAAKKRWPKAVLWGHVGLKKKSPNLPLDRLLADVAEAEWAETLRPQRIPSMLGETVFLHERDGTVITSDLIENWPAECDHWWTRTYLKLSGIYGKPGWARPLRFVFRDKRAARDSIDAVLAWDFERMVLAHGDVLTRDAKSALHAGYEWLRP